MTLKNTFKTAITGLAAHKLRSALTILGIVIGVAAIIIVMTIGQGAQNLIVSQVSAFGADTLIAVPGDLNNPESQYYTQGFTQRDLDALKRLGNAPNVTEVIPLMVVPGTLTYQNEKFSGAQIVGGSAQLIGDVFRIEPEEGLVFTEADEQSRLRVVVIGHAIKEEFFGDSQAVGEQIAIDGVQFRVLAAYPDTGQRGIFNVDNLVIIPHTTAQVVSGKNTYDEFIIKVDDPANVNKAEFDVIATLRESRGFDLDDEVDFTVVSQQGLVDQISSIVGILTAFLSMVVAISLVVGGIGIMNIMLVSVTERTREIGLRKAVGATQKNILQQFLFEAVILTSLGGILGIFIGTVISFGASLVLAQTVASDWQFSFAWSAAALGLGVSAAVGVVFGLYPAYQASLKSPIEALRYE